MNEGTIKIGNITYSYDAEFNQDKWYGKVYWKASYNNSTLIFTSEPKDSYIEAIHDAKKWIVGTVLYSKAGEVKK